jgi:hypothetical protein
MVTIKTMETTPFEGEIVKDIVDDPNMEIAQIVSQESDHDIAYVKQINLSAGNESDLIDEQYIFPPPPANPNFVYAESQFVDDEFKCEICHNPLTAPVTSECDHVFCQSCINDTTICPTCQKPLQEVTPIKLKRFLSLLEKVLVECTHCHRIMERGKFEAHKGECPVMCPKACGEIISRNTWEHHSLFCIRMKIPCSAAEFSCDWKGPQPNLPAHLETCIFEKMRPVFDRARNQTASLVTGHRYECSWREGILDGHGSISYPYGAKLEADYTQGRPIGKVTIIQDEKKIWTGISEGDLSTTQFTSSFTGSTYIGQWKAGQRHGIGTSLSTEGNTYFGDWKDDKMDGVGSYTFASGNKYDGDWKAGNQHGKGTFSFVDGHVYAGDWKDDMQDGVGTMKYSNGNQYHGEWKNNSLEGFGTMSFLNGDQYVGEWKAYRKNGRGTYHFAEGNKYRGEWQNDEMNGKGVMEYVNGDRFEGEWRNGKQHGNGIYITKARETVKGSFIFISAYEQKWRDGVQMDR